MDFRNLSNPLSLLLYRPYYSYTFRSLRLVLFIHFDVVMDQHEVVLVAPFPTPSPYNI